MRLGNAWKAIVAFIAPGAVVIAAATTDKSMGGSSIVMAEWVTAICAMFITGAATYTTPPGKNLKTPE